MRFDTTEIFKFKIIQNAIYFSEIPSMSLLFEKYILDLPEKQGLTFLSAMYNFCWEKY